MKGRMILVMLGAVTMAGVVHAQANDGEKLLGVWRGQMETLPAVTLNVTNEGGGVSGAILFYLIKRSFTMSEPTTSTPGIPEPLMNARFDGNTLVFDVSHRRAHPPRTLSDPPVHFRMKLVDADKAELVNETEKSSPAVVLVRDK